MTALDLHHAIFTNEKPSSDLPLRSASSFLYSAPDRDNDSPTSRLFASRAYQDIVQRQPMHPDGPALGWDLGLNLLGDPLSSAEHKSMDDYQTKLRLRRLHATNLVLELAFGIWATYATIRYFVAFSYATGSKHVWALVLGTLSALVLGLVSLSLSLPRLPQRPRSNTAHARWRRHLRSSVRIVYLFFLSVAAISNLVLVAIAHPDRTCGWDVDISWYTPATPASTCVPASFATWITAATMRVLSTWTTTCLFAYTLHAYHRTRHPHVSSDAECRSPLANRSDSDTLTQFTFKSTSMSTLAHSRSHSTPVKDKDKERTSPPMSRRTSSVHVGRADTPARTRESESDDTSGVRSRSGSDPSSSKTSAHSGEVEYGYGACGPTYPYLDMYNPEPTTVEVDEDGEEYVAMMGGFVRRMATIESLGSKEASRHYPSPFSSVRFASSLSSGSVGTTYLSFSTGGVSERGERLKPGSYFAASGTSVWRTEEG